MFVHFNTYKVSLWRKIQVNFQISTYQKSITPQFFQKIILHKIQIHSFMWKPYCQFFFSFHYFMWNFLIKNRFNHWRGNKNKRISFMLKYEHNNLAIWYYWLHLKNAINQAGGQDFWLNLFFFLKKKTTPSNNLSFLLKKITAFFDFVQTGDE